MNCQYIKENETHEKYILDRLNESDKNKYLYHLKKCDACHEEFEKQRSFIFSIREIGKREMKSDIAIQVQELKSRKTVFDWDMILKVAAIFFFLVITPGLVYYYQTVEPPKTAELIDIDEYNQITVAEKERSTEVVQLKTVEKKIPKSESEELLPPAPRTRSSAKSTVDNRLAKTLSNAGGSTGKKLKKNEVRLENESVPLAEKSIPKSPQPVDKDIPNIEYFSKPLHQKTDEKSLDEMNDLMGKSADATRAKIQTESYSENQIQSASIKKHKYKKDGFRVQKQEQLLQFENNGKIIHVIMEIHSQELEEDKESLFPITFPVQIQQKDSLALHMKWFVNSKFINVNNQDISLTLAKKNIAYIALFEKIFYEINLLRKKTEAVLVNYSSLQN